MTRKKWVLSKIRGRKTESEILDAQIQRKLEYNLDLVTDE